MTSYPRSKWHILTVKVDNEFKKMLEIMARKYRVSIATIVRYSIVYVIEEHLLLGDDITECQLAKSDNIIEYNRIVNIIHNECIPD